MAVNSRFEQLKRFARDVDSCIECGTCTIWCPVYQAKPVEASVARGKNQVIRELLDGNTRHKTQDIAEVLSTCTLCMACTEHCPVQSNVPTTIVAARADQASGRSFGLLSRLIYRRVIPNRRLLARAVRAASWVQRKTSLLSGRPDGNRRPLPVIAPASLKRSVPVINRPRRENNTGVRVGYFVGCVTDFVFPELGKRVIDFLTGHGYEVIVPEAQGCCGAPVFLGAGDFQTGRKLADAHVRLFEDVDYVVSACATCSSALKHYARFLADTSERKASYTLLAGKVRDLLQFLFQNLSPASADYRSVPEVRGKKITWHDPCHLSRHLGVKEEPRMILKSLSDVQYIEMARADFCCGMGGAFGITHYGLSKKIGDKAAETIEATGADVVVTACPSCMIQLADACDRNGLSRRVAHIMEILE